MNLESSRVAAPGSVVRYAWVDQIRGLAMLGVIAVHVGQRIYAFSGPLQDLAVFGSSGVQLIFVVSAMTLCMSMARRPTGYWQFLLRRFFRIAPLYYFGIAFYGALAFLGFRDFSVYTFSNVFANITFLNGFVPAANNNIVPGGWAIATEVSFYVVFPMLFALLTSFRRVLVFTTAFASVCVTGLLLGWLDGVIRFFGIALVQKSLLMQLPCFLAGFGAYYILRGRASCSIHLQIAAISVFAVCAVAAAALWKSGEPIGIFLRLLSLGISFASLCVLLRWGLLERVPGSALLADFGRRSYSIYLTQFVFAWGMVGAVEPYVAQWLSRNMQFLLYFGVVAFLSYVCAGITMRFIEIPGARLGDILSARWYPHAGEGGSAISATQARNVADSRISRTHRERP